RNSHWLHSFPEEQRVASMTIADMSPALASRRVVLLCERQQYREAANLVTRLGQATFKAILPELPVEVFLDAVPQSLHLLEALYAKVFLSEGLNFSLKLLKPEALVFQMVRLFAQHADDSGFEQDYTRNRFVAAPVMLSSCKKLLKVIVLTEPRMRHQLSGRKKALERALEGLGQHGLVGASGGVLVHLHDALRAELDLLLHQLKVSAQKLDALAAQGPQRVSLSHGPAPTTASHQRQLSMRQGQVQERLIKNKTLLNALESVDQAGLEGLLAVLRRRIQLDKDVLFQAGPPVPGCSRSSHILLFTVEAQRFRIVGRDPAVPAGVAGQIGAPPLFVHWSPTPRTGSAEHDSSRVQAPNAGGMFEHNIFWPSQKMGVISALRRRCPIETLNKVGVELGHQRIGKDVISTTLHRSCIRDAARDRVQDRPAAESEPSDPIRVREKRGDGGVVGERGGSLVGPQFTQLRKESPDLDEGTVVAPVLLRYSTGCHHVLDLMRDVGADDEDDSDLSAGYHSDSDHGELARARQTILVLQQRQRELQDRLASQAQKMIERSPRFENLAHCERRPTVLIRRYGSLYAQARVDTLDALDALPQLRDADELKTKLLFSVVVVIDSPTVTTTRRLTCLFALAGRAQEVCAQIWATLYDYPCLKGCQGLARYVRDCVRLAWALTVQGFGIEYETRVFRRDLHVRFHTSNHESDHIRTYLWPALLRAAPQGACVHKGVVVT
ncbi:hypothetical protein IscW_ISCW001706, partial [Ixodes scapularis]